MAGSAVTISLSTIEPIVSAAGEVVVAILKYMESYRASMSEANRDRYDTLLLNSIERWDRWAKTLDRLITGE